MGSKRGYNFLLSILVFLISTSPVAATPIQKIENISDPFLQLEAALQLRVDIGKDSIALKKAFDPLLLLAQKNNNIPLEWAYYMLMADGFSVHFDQTNVRSNHYFRLAEKLLHKHPNPNLAMVGNIREGYYYFVYRKVIDAFPYFLKANDLRTKTKSHSIPLLAKHFQYIASFFNYIGDTDKAVDYLECAVPFAEKATRPRIDLINSIAVYLSKNGDEKRAISYFDQAMHEAILAKDSVWIGIISGNLADYAWRKGDKSEAIELVKKNIALSMQYDDHIDAMRANLVLAGWHIALKEWDTARQHVAASINLMEDKPYYLKYKMDASKKLSDIAHGTGESDKELQYLQRYIALRDSLEQRTNIKEAQRIIWNYEKEKYQRDIESAEQKQRQTTRKYQYLGILIVLVFAIIILLIHRSRSKIKLRTTLLEKNQLALSYEKQLLDQEVSLLKNSLTEFTNTIKSNNLTIQQLRLELTQEASEKPAAVMQISNQLNSLLKTHIMTDERWQQFRYVFDKVYPGYLSKMKETNEKITENDLKILALIKLDLSNASMSELLCISIEGIKKAKQRLKKKLA